MCGRFVNTNTINKLKKVFNVDKSFILTDNNISYNLSPSQNINVITNKDNFFIESANWGIKFLDNNNKLCTVINSRSETIQNKILFKDSFIKRKCVVPANGYYEWRLEKGIKIPYFIQIPTLEPIYFAGLWKYSNFNTSKNKTISILTKKASKFINDIHHRMPVIFDINEAINYLININPSFEFNISLNYEKYLNFFSVSKFVNSPLNNSLKCIQPIN